MKRCLVDFNSILYNIIKLFSSSKKVRIYFHDTFIKLGPLPLPLIRRAMLGDLGGLF